MKTHDLVRLFDKAGGYLHQDDADTWCFKYEQLNYFVNMIIKRDREACAKRLEAVGCDHCAANIRARKQI